MHSPLDERTLDDADRPPLDEIDDLDRSPEPVEPPEPLTDIDEPSPPRRYPSPAALWALGVVVAACRWIFSQNRDMFHMAPDEPAQLAMARWISGGLRWNMFDHATWAPGQATLMAPLFWFTDDTATIVHGGLLIGAALGGIGAVLLARLGTRLTPLGPAGSVLAAAAIALTPSSLSATAFVWSEALATVCFLSIVTLMLKFYDAPKLSTGAAVVTMAAIGFVAHGRLLPLVVLTAVAALYKCVISRLWMRCLAIATIAAGVTGLAFAYTAFVYEHVWDKPGTSNTSGTIWKRLPRVEDNLRSALGQVWYQLIATLGLTAIGAAVVVYRSMRRRGRTPYSVIRDARLLIFLTLPLVVVSMIFMSGRTRTDHRIYGRYNDGVLWPVLLIAIGWLTTLRVTRMRRAAVALLTFVAAAMVAASYGIHQVAGKALEESAGVRPMVAGLMPMIGRKNSIDVTRVTVIAAIGLVALVILTLIARRGVLLIPVAVVVLAWSGWNTHETMSNRLNSWEPGIEVREIRDEVPDGAVLGIRFVRDDDDDTPPISWDDQRRRGQVYQFALPDHRFVRDGGPDDDVGPWVFAPLGDRLMKASGAELVWTDPKVKFGLWKEHAPE
jgi:hypothetical protein